MAMYIICILYVYEDATFLLRAVTVAIYIICIVYVFNMRVAMYIICISYVYNMRMSPFC